MSTILLLSIFLAIVVILFSSYELYSSDSSIAKKVVLSLVIVLAVASLPYLFSELNFINTQISEVEDLLNI
jgi:hypothetical protein